MDKAGTTSELQSTKRLTAAMTKRTAPLAAAAKKISSKARKITKAPPTTGSSNPAKSVSSKVTDSNTCEDINKPWYTVFSKSDPEYNRYMATEWGFEKRGDKVLFEKICLEGAQSGLSWLTILRKREAYRRTFFNFDIETVASMTAKDIQRILDSDEKDPTNMVVRHRGKIEATINNAKCIQEMYKDDKANKKPGKHKELFDSFLWSFVDDKPILNTKWKQGEGLTNALSKSPDSEAMSKALKKLGFRFVGPTTCYAMMQSAGMVIDHPVGSPEWDAALDRLKQRPGGYQHDTDVRDQSGRSETQEAAAKKPKAKTKRATNTAGSSKRAKK